MMMNAVSGVGREGRRRREKDQKDAWLSRPMERQGVSGGGLLWNCVLKYC